MARKKSAARQAPASTATYSLREEQTAMPGLPTKPPAALTEEQRTLGQLQEAPDMRLRRLVAQHRRPPDPEGQFGFFFAPTAAHQESLFKLDPEPRKR